MPIYEYRCTNCGKSFEIFQRISDKPLRVCKFCNGSLTKLISNCSFQLKGTGWYATDYKKPIDSAGKKTASGNGGKEETRTETKVETPTESAPKTENKSADKTGG